MVTKPSLIENSVCNRRWVKGGADGRLVVISGIRHVLLLVQVRIDQESKYIIYLLLVDFSAGKFTLVN